VSSYPSQDDAVARYLKRSTLIPRVALAVVLLVLIAGVVLTSVFAVRAADVSAQSEAADVALAQSSDALSDAESKHKGAQNREIIERENMEGAIQRNAQTYDLEVARGVENGTIPAPVWPARYGYDAGLKAKMDAADAAAREPFILATEVADSAERHLAEVREDNARALGTAMAVSLDADEARSQAIIVGLASAIAVAVLATVWFILSTLTARARATMALQSGSGSATRL
jgi:hypothetical protein